MMEEVLQIARCTGHCCRSFNLSDDEILSFVGNATMHAIALAHCQQIDGRTIMVDGKTTSGEIVFSNIVDTYVEAAVTVKLRTYNTRLMEGKASRELKEEP